MHALAHAYTSTILYHSHFIAVFVYKIMLKNALGMQPTHTHTHVCEACISNMSHVFVVDTSFFLPLLLCFEIYVYFTQSATHADQPFA